jgi:spore maturation protein CgeB
MRVVVMGAGGRHKTEASIARAVRTVGHACRMINAVGWMRHAGALGSRAVRYQVDSFEPDFVLLTRPAIRVGEATLQALLRGRESAFWYFDLHAIPQALALGRLARRMYTTSFSEVGSLCTAGLPWVGFLPQGVDPEADFPARASRPEDECDVSFVGSGQYPHRYPVLRAVAAVARLQVRGPGWSSAPADLPTARGPVHGRRLAQVIRGAAISLGANAHAEQDSARASASNRMWKVLGCGGFFLGRWVEDIEHFARGGQHCAWYRSPLDAADQVRRYLAEPGERARIAAAGRAHALRHHTFAQRLDLLLNGREYRLDSTISDDRIVPELENPHAGQPLDHA